MRDHGKSQPPDAPTAQPHHASFLQEGTHCLGPELWHLVHRVYSTAVKRCVSEIRAQRRDAPRMLVDHVASIGENESRVLHSGDGGLVVVDECCVVPAKRCKGPLQFGEDVQQAYPVQKGA